MKIHLDVDLTPEEARRFLGLPDVAPMQERMMQDIEARMKTALDKLDAAELMKTWMPLGMEGWEQFRRAFWSASSAAAASSGKTDTKPSE